MSSSAKIKSAGDKISFFVKLKGGNSSRVDQGVTKTTSTLEEKEEFDGHGDAADATVATYEKVVESIEKFESGDPAQITIGVLDILAEVSQFAALAGPTGAIVAAVVGPLCSIISSLLGAGTGEPVESEEDMLRRVVTEALEVAKFEDLLGEAAGVTEELSDNMRRARTFLDMGDDLGSSDRNFILHNMAGSDSGNAFLAKLSYYINRDTATDNQETAGRTAQLITSYVNIAYVRIQYLYMLSSLLGGDEESKGVARDTLDEAKDQISDAKNFLKSFLGRPNKTFNVVYSKVFLEPQTTLELMEGICNKRSAGRLVAIYNTKQKRYLHVSQSKHSCSEAKTIVYHRFYSMPNATKFVVFNIGYIENAVSFFSLDHTGYVWVEGLDPVDDDRRIVNVLKKGDEVREGVWLQVSEDSHGKKQLKNTWYEEYMYAADWNATENTNPVYTWRKGNPVSQGYWIFEDLKVPGDTKRIRSISSGNYLNGRATLDGEGYEHIMLTNFQPEYPPYFDWYLIKLSDGTYNIKSRTSNMYLDGRNEGIGDGPHVGLWHLSDEKARNSHFFKWHITEHFYDGKKRYAIQSVSSNLYLDGRNPEHVGTKMLYITGRNPEGDKHLMWDLL